MTESGGYPDTGQSLFERALELTRYYYRLSPDAAVTYRPEQENTMSTDDEAMQLDIFGGESPMPTTPAESAPTIVPRRSGWVLLGGHRARHRVWHAVVSGSGGTVLTSCGATGHVINEDQPEIIRCPECVAALGD